MADNLKVDEVTDFDTKVDDAEELADEQVAAAESEEQTEQRKKDEKKAKLKEFGGAVSFRKLFSTATWGEIIIFIVGLISALIQGAGQPALCVFFGRLIDKVSATGGDMDVFFENVGEVALQFTMIGVVTLVVATLNNLCFGYFTEVQVARMRPIYFNRLLNRDIGWFDTHDPGSLPSEMDEDLDIYQTGLGSKLGISIMSMSTVVLGYTFALLLSWKVSLFVTAVLPVMAFGAVIMAQSVMDMMMEKQGAYATAAKLMDEVLFAVRTVVSFGGEYRELRRYQGGVDTARKGGIVARLKAGLGMGYIMSLYTASIGLAFYVGMRMVRDGEDLSVGELMSAFFCVIMGGFTLGQVPPGLTGLVQARVSMARFYYILENDSEIQRAGEDKREACPPITSLALSDVRFSYPSRPTIKVLQGVSLTISKGQKVAVVGESGSGKSTIMALLERFYDPTSGQVLVNGQDLKKFSISSYRSHIGYVGQEPVLFATSVRKNIMQGSADATTEDMRRVAEYANLGFVEKLPQGFDTFVGSGGSQFSGGQKQRIAIARALIKKPSMLFLDEATSALDSTSEKMIQDTIDHIGTRSDLGMTIVTIAHRLSTVKNSDVIFVMKDGVVAEQGNHQELTHKTGGLYQALAAAQAMTIEKADSSPTTANKNDEGEVSPVPGRVLSDGKKGASSEKLADQQMPEEEREKLREKEIAKTYRVPFLRIFKFCKQEWWAFIPGFLGAGMSGATFPLVGAYALVDGMIAFLEAPADMDKFRDEIHQVCILLLILAAMKFLGTIMQFLFFAILGEAITMRARMTMLTSIFRQEIGYHDNPDNTPSRLVKSLSVYAFRISAFCTTLGNSADAIVAVGVGVGMAFYYQPIMAAVMLCSVPIFAVAQAIEISVTMGATKNESTQLKQATQIVGESLLGARTVHASGTEKDVVELYQGLTGADSKRTLSANMKKGIGYGLSQGVIFWVCAGGFYFMGFLIDEGTANFSEGMRAFMGVLYAGLGAGMAFAVVSDVAKAKIAAHDMFKMIDRESAINGLEATGVTPTAEERGVGRIELEDVKFFYPFRPDVQVLRGLSFTVEPGQSVGLCGPSGGGKSTVFAMIQRFYDPQNGKVFVGSGRMALNEINVRWWRRQVGFVGQEPILFDTSILENVRYGLEDNEALSDERLAQVKRMANLSFIDGRKAQGWSTQVGPRGSRLSGGQKQRVAIARALVRDPPILLLDEATSALDSNSEKIVAKALAGARQGRTSFAIAHRLSTIQDCDKIIVVADGQLVEQGNHDELVKKNGVYAKLHAQSTNSK